MNRKKKAQTFIPASLQNSASFSPGLINLNWKLIIRNSLLGALFGVTAGCLIFFGFPQLSNYNVEEYILAAVLLIAALTALITFRQADSRKILHAIIVLFAVCGLTVLSVVILVLVSLFVLCGSSPCKFISL
jgi:hypothetical protein